jgi:hypothetical protein
MKMSWFRFSMVAVLAASLAVPAPVVLAGVISTDEAIRTDHRADRDKVREFLDRASVRDKLLAFGVSALTAKSRVDALTDQEAAQLAQRIDALPAGGTLSQNDLIIILLIAILVAVVAA